MKIVITKQEIKALAKASAGIVATVLPIDSAIRNFEKSFIKESGKYGLTMEIHESEYILNINEELMVELIHEYGDLIKGIVCLVTSSRDRFERIVARY